MMSRKDYRKIAAAIKEAAEHYRPGTSSREGVADAAREIAAALKSDNPRFRYDFFFEACGLNEWGEEAKTA